MKCIIKQLAVTGFCFVLASSFTLSTFAGAITSLKNNVINELEDDDFESFLTGNIGDTLVPGDIFMGVLRVQAVNEFPGGNLLNPANDDATFTALFLIEVAFKATNADGTFVYFKPVGTTDWSSLTGYDLPNPNNANTIAIFWDDVLIGDATQGALGSDVQDSVDSFVGSNKVYEFGFAGTDFADDGVSDLGEFFVAAGAAGTDVVGFRPSTITNLINLSLLESFNNARPLAKHTTLASEPDEQEALLAGVSFTNATHLQGRGGIESIGNAGAWDIKTDTDLYILPIPEPSSIVLWGIGALGLGLAAARRRKQAVTA